MFTIWRGEGTELKMVNGAQTLESVIGIIDGNAIGRYDVCESAVGIGDIPRVWGYVTRNEDAPSLSS